jgi:A/G-specific adenine glycosylase
MFYYLAFFKQGVNNTMVIENLTVLLLRWYDCAARDLPWRQEKDPYRIWVSEVMLQQTRVEAVKPYYERWVGRYPTAASLAESSEDEVLQYWQGLGYYSRARNLLRGVQEVCSRYGGKIPDNKPEIESLSGIGDYTAGAILSIAYGKREPAIDGNVLRVFSRLFCIYDEISQTAVKNRIRELVQQFLPSDRPGDFNQALMDLGAMLCIPGQPRCSACPLSTHCLAFQQQAQGEVPVKKRKTKPKLVTLAAAIVQRGDAFLLCRRPGRGILAGMWEFPTVELPDNGVVTDLLPGYLRTVSGISTVVKEKLLALNHVFSHRQWDISFYRCGLFANPEQVVEDCDNCRWLNVSEWEGICFAGPHRQMAKYLMEQA